MVFFTDRRDENLVFPDFADQFNVSATEAKLNAIGATKGNLTVTGATERKLVAAVKTLVAAGEKIATENFFFRKNFCYLNFNKLLKLLSKIPVFQLNVLGGLE